MTRRRKFFLYVHFLARPILSFFIFFNLTYKAKPYPRPDFYIPPQDLNHWSTGWVDWNMALDMQGGPNWANNFVDSPIIIDAVLILLNCTFLAPRYPSPISTVFLMISLYFENIGSQKVLQAAYVLRVGSLQQVHEARRQESLRYKEPIQNSVLKLIKNFRFNL